MASRSSHIGAQHWSLLPMGWLDTEAAGPGMALVCGSLSRWAHVTRFMASGSVTAATPLICPVTRTAECSHRVVLFVYFPAPVWGALSNGHYHEAPESPRSCFLCMSRLPHTSLPPSSSPASPGPRPCPLLAAPPDGRIFSSPYTLVMRPLCRVSPFTNQALIFPLLLAVCTGPYL